MMPAMGHNSQFWTSADREPVAALLAVAGEPGPEQDRPGVQDAAFSQAHGPSMLAGPAEPFGQHGPVATAPARRRQRDRALQLGHLAGQRTATGALLLQMSRTISRAGHATLSA